MSDLSIDLGSCCADGNGIHKEGGVHGNAGVAMSAPTLQQAAKNVSETVGGGGGGDVWKSLRITVAASEFATAWSNPMDLASFRLQESAVVTVVVTPDAVDDDSSTGLSAIHTSFLLASLQGTSERKESNGTRVLTAQKTARTSQPSSAKAIALPNIKKPTTTTTAVTISLDDDNADMIDEDDLLQDEADFAPDMNGTVVLGAASTDDCGGRTACDNCTCGRAEQEQANIQQEGQQQQQPKPIQTSACGKCGLGDAFRCASCPYLGKPAFKAGEEHLVLLDLQDDF